MCWGRGLSSTAMRRRTSRSRRARAQRWDRALRSASCAVRPSRSRSKAASRRRWRQAQAADVVLLAVGESSNMSGEAQSVTDIRVPKAQRELAEAVAATGKPVVVLLRHGRALALSGAIADAPAILATWFLGSEDGDAVADVVFGKVNPSRPGRPGTFLQRKRPAALFLQPPHHRPPRPRGREAKNTRRAIAAPGTRRATPSATG